MLHDSQHASAESFTASPPERIHGGGGVCVELKSADLG